jgi:hypothetical protein
MGKKIDQRAKLDKKRSSTREILTKLRRPLKNDKNHLIFNPGILKIFVPKYGSLAPPSPILRSQNCFQSKN